MHVRALSRFSTLELKPSMRVRHGRSTPSTVNDDDRVATLFTDDANDALNYDLSAVSNDESDEGRRSTELGNAGKCSDGSSNFSKCPLLLINQVHRTAAQVQHRCHVPRPVVRRLMKISISTWPVSALPTVRTMTTVVALMLMLSPWKTLLRNHWRPIYKKGNIVCTAARSEVVTATCVVRCFAVAHVNEALPSTSDATASQSQAPLVVDTQLSDANRTLDTSLIELPPAAIAAQQHRQAALGIRYAKRQKRINAKKVKTEIWRYLTRDVKVEAPKHGTYLCALFIRMHYFARCRGG